MTDVQISELTQTETPYDADLLLIRHGTVDTKIEYDDLRKAILTNSLFVDEYGGIETEVANLYYTKTEVDNKINAIKNTYFNILTQDVTSNNIDNFTTTGIYCGYIQGGDMISSNPFDNTFGILIVSNHHNTATRIGQTIFLPYTAYLAARFKTDDTWSNWRATRCPVVNQG